MPRPAKTKQEIHAWRHLVTLLHGGEFAAWLATHCPAMPMAAAKELEEARSYVQFQLMKQKARDNKRRDRGGT